MVTQNQLELVQICLHSLSFVHSDPTIEWIIWDNASTDGTAEWLQAYAKDHPDLTVICSSRDIGQYKARVQLCTLAKHKQNIVLRESTVPAFTEEL